MKVYLLMRNYYDGCDSWETVENIYKTYDDAFNEAQRLNLVYAKYNTCYTDVSYCVEERTVF